MAETRPDSPRDTAARDRARAALEARKFEAALAEAGRAIAQDPGDGLAHAVLASALMNLERHAEAQAAAERGLGHAPELEWLHRLRSNALRAQGRYGEALEAAGRLVEVAPHEGISHYTLGLAYYCLGRFDEAREAFLRTLSLRPDHVETHRWLGEIALEGDLALAEERFRAALAKDPGWGPAMIGLAKILYHRGQQDEALALFDRAVLAMPGDRFVRQDALAAARQWMGAKAGPGALLTCALGLAAGAASWPVCGWLAGSHLPAWGAVTTGFIGLAVGMLGERARRRSALRRRAPRLAALWAAGERTPPPAA